MGKIAFVFSGQGAQYSGMGKELYESSAAVRTYFDTADKIRPGTSKQCFEGAEEELSRTDITQPCLFCVDFAAALALQEAGIKADMTAGFSIGELVALTWAGVFSAEDGFALVCRRGEVMQAAAEQTDASMIAVLKLEDETVAELCRNAGSAYPVNFNSPGQVVVSGTKAAIEELKPMIKEKGGRAIPLKVGGGFHSPFMIPAAEKFEAILKKTEFRTAKIPVYANVTGELYPEDAASVLAKQISHPVLWKQSIERMAKDGAECFVELGPGKVLCGLISRIIPDAKVFHVEDAESLKETVEGVQKYA